MFSVVNMKLDVYSRGNDSSRQRSLIVFESAVVRAVSNGLPATLDVRECFFFITER